MSKVPSRRINSPFLIGIFVITGMVITIAVILWLGASQFLKEKNFYVTYFDSSVEGLETGSPVKYLGVPVGTISNVHVAEDGRLIEVVMQIDKKISYNDSLRAKAEFAGIAGGKFIQLYFPTDPKIAAMYPDLGFKPTHKLIRSAPSGLEEIEIAMRDVMNKLRLIEYGKISNSTVSFLDKTTEFFENEKLYSTIDNLEKTSAKLSAIAERADTSRILDFIANASSRLYQTTVELKLFADKLNEQVDNLGLDKHVEDAFSRYDSTMISTQKVIESLGYRSNSALVSLNEVLEEIKKTNRKLQKSLRVVSDNPSQILLANPPPPEE